VGRLPLTSRRIHYAIITGGVLALSVVAFVNLNRAPTTEDVAIAALAAVARRQPDELFELIPDEERTLYGNLTRDRLKNLLVLAGFGTDCVLEGPVSVHRNVMDGSAEASQGCTSQNLKLSLALVAELRQDRKVLLKAPVTRLLNYVLYSAGTGHVPNLAANASRGPIYLEGLTRKEASLRKIGFEGVADSDLSRVLPWQQLRWNLEHGVSGVPQESR
jgi:hypothetical protein